MAFPVDSARQGTNITTAATSHTINVGSPVSGTLLIVLVCFPSAPGTVTFTGYTLLSSFIAWTDEVLHVYYRQADGTEGATDALSTTSSVKLCAISWEITGAANPATQAPQVSTSSIGSGGSVMQSNPITPTGGAKDYLFMSLGLVSGETSFPTAQPASYANLVTANSGTGGAATTNCIGCGATRQANTATETPGPFTHPLGDVGAITVAVHPPAGATTHTKAGFSKADPDGFGVSQKVAGAAPGPAFRRQRRASRYLTFR